MCAIRSSPFFAVISYVFFLRFHGSLKWCLMPLSIGLLKLRPNCLEWVFLPFSLRLRFSFYLGPLSPVYLLVTAQWLAPGTFPCNRTVCRTCHGTFFLHHGKRGLLSVLHQMSIDNVHWADWTQVGGPL